MLTAGSGFICPSGFAFCGCCAPPQALAAEFQYRQLTSGKGTGPDPLSCVGVFEANPELLAAWLQVCISVSGFSCAVA